MRERHCPWLASAREISNDPLLSRACTEKLTRCFGSVMTNAASGIRTTKTVASCEATLTATTLSKNARSRGVSRRRRVGITASLSETCIYQSSEISQAVNPSRVFSRSMLGVETTGIEPATPSLQS